MELSSFWSRYPLAQSQLSKPPDRDDDDRWMMTDELFHLYFTSDILLFQCNITICKCAIESSYELFNKVNNINECIYLYQDPI